MDRFETFFSQDFVGAISLLETVVGRFHLTEFLVSSIETGFKSDGPTVQGSLLEQRTLGGVDEQLLEVTDRVLDISISAQPPGTIFPFRLLVRLVGSTKSIVEP